MIKQSYKSDQLFMTQETMNCVCKHLTSFLRANTPKKLILFESTSGDGRFVNKLKTQFPNSIILANDIDPEMAKIIPGAMNYDFNIVKWDEYLRKININSKDVIICTGFPYGSRSQLAIDCLNTVAKYFFGAVVILPATLNKTTNIDRITRNLHLISSDRLPIWSFQKQGRSDNITVGSIITSWIATDINRKLYNSVKTHPDFSFISFGNVEKGEKYDIVIKQKFNNLKIYNATDGYNKSVYKRNAIRYANAGQDFLFIKIHNAAKFTKTINEFNWKILYNNAISIGHLSKKDFIIAHEYINYGMHQKYITLIS